MTNPPLTLDDVRAAARRLRDHVTRTPVVTSPAFDDATGHTVFFKCENLQRAGAFKIRGALNKLLTLTEEERRMILWDNAVRLFKLEKEAERARAVSQNIAA